MLGEWVDFEYSVNGKMYEFSLPGGEYMTLHQLVEVLDINEDTNGADIDRFIADIKTVEFSDPSLVWVGKVEEDCTLGALKDGLGLVCEYSGELSEEQIEEINGNTVSAGEWILISLKAFDTEETMTVTMKDGEVWTVEVTDAQISADVLTAGGETYTVTVEYDDDARIPDGAHLRATEIAAGSDLYGEYLTASAEELGADSESILLARFFDLRIVEIVDGEERELEPQAPVKVTIALKEELKQEDALSVVHFLPEGPQRVDGAQLNELQDVEFTAESFSVYGVITMPAPTGADDLDGRAFTMSIGGRYVTDQAVTLLGDSSNTNGLGKTTDASGAAQWRFEQVSGSTYKIVDTNNGSYLTFTKNPEAQSEQNTRAHATLTDDGTVFTVEKVGNEYRISTQIDGTTYYLDEHNGASGPGFAGWYIAGSNNALTLNFTQLTTQAGSDYMVLVKLEEDGEDVYYIVLNDGTLEEVQYNPEDGSVTVEDPMLWHYTGDHIHHNSTQVGFTGQALPSAYYYKYIDPSSETGLNEDDASNTTTDGTPDNQGAGPKITSRALWSTTALVYTADHKLQSASNGGYYIGVTEQNGKLMLKGQSDASEAVEVFFADAVNVTAPDWARHVVNHIDISIDGTAAVDVPLAYGKYYDENGEVVMDVTSFQKLHLDEASVVNSDDLVVTPADMKNSSISAYLDDGTYLDDAFYVTGYSANPTYLGESAQVRIEGAFKVAQLDGKTFSIPTGGTWPLDAVDVNAYNNDWFGYKGAVHQARLNNQVHYNLTVTKPVEFRMRLPVEDGEGNVVSYTQLYDADGKPLKIMADVAFSASFAYWDGVDSDYWDDPNRDEENATYTKDGKTYHYTGNECPPIFKSEYNDWAQWRNGYIATHNMSGMDFRLGGGAEGETKIYAVEITKLVVDENGNRIKSNNAGRNTFNVYKNPSTDAGLVKDLNVGAYTEPMDLSDYALQHTKSLSVGAEGMGTVYDYDVRPGLYTISEDPESVLEVITDTSGKTWDYKETYILTEYAWRNHANDNYMHVSPTYAGGEEEYAAVPEILGDHYGYNGTDGPYTNDFLEFYVYNVYESPKVDVPVIKSWQDFDGEGHEGYDWQAEFKLQWAPLYEDESTPSTSFQDVSPQQTLTITKAKMDGITQELVSRYLAGDETLTQDEISKIEAVTFKDLPKYGTDAQGDTYRIQYSLEEISYTVTDSASGVVQYSWDENGGYNTGDEESHYHPFYLHDAGEKVSGNTDDQNEGNTNYYVSVKNAKKQIREKTYIDVTLDKQWDGDNDGTLDTRDDSYYAKFELRRYARTEYRDLSHMSDSDKTADPITITIKNGDTVVDTLQVQPNIGLYLAGNFKPHSEAKTITFTADKQVRFANDSRSNTITVTADGSNESNALVRSREFFLTEDTVFTLTSGADNLVTETGSSMAKVLDTSAGTSPLPDKTFSQEITLNKDNNWHVDLSNLIVSETSAGDDDDNENVVYYEYYLVEKESYPEGYAQYFLANNGNLTTTLAGDADHRINSNESIIAVNGPTNRLIVKKVWRGVPDTTGYPGITFTLYQTWADDQNGNGWIYTSESGTTYENIELKGQSLEWICPEVLPTTRLDGSTSRAVKYYVVENTRSGSVTDGSITTSWQFYYYLNSKDAQTNAGHQGHNVALTGSDLAADGGTITICNKMDAYMQLDIQKQFFELRDAGSWYNTTASEERTKSTILGFKVIRAIKTSDSRWLNDKGEEVAEPYWMDYSSELLCGYDENGQQVWDSGEDNFWLHGAGGDWAFRIEDNQGDANDINAGGTGLPKYGFFIENGEVIPVEYYYSYRETNVYKDLNRTPYDNWDWFSSITPVNAYGAGGSFEAFDKVFHGQDVMRVANFQASDLVIDKQWIGDVAASEVYVKLWRVSGNEDPEDFTAVIADDIRYNNNWQMYVRDTSTVDVYRKCLILKDDGSGNWTTSMTVNRALLGALAETGRYSYYIQEVGYKTLDGTYKTNVNAKFKPLYTHWEGTAEEGAYSSAPVGANDYAGNAITIKEKGANKLRVINRSTPSTSYSVTKAFAGSVSATGTQSSMSSGYPTDGSKQVVVELQQRYRYEYTKDGVTYVLNKDTTSLQEAFARIKADGWDASSDSEWILATDSDADNQWLVDWQGAESASPVSVALPRSKPVESSLTDAQWYASAAAWTYSWDGLDLVKVIADDSDPDKKVTAQLYYRAVETSTPEWMNTSITDKTVITDDADGHKAVDDDSQTAAEIRAESNTVTNTQGTTTLKIDKEWTGLGEGVTWPEGYVVYYQVVQNYHLAAADVSGTKTEDGLTYIDPSYSYGDAFKSVDMTSSPTDATNADMYNPRAASTIENTDGMTLTGLPLYGFLTATAADVEEAAEHGVTLVEGTVYPVVYTYSVRETKVTKNGVEQDFKAQTIDSEASKTEENTYTATLKNEFTSLKLTKKWTKNGQEKDNFWPTDYTVEYTIVRESVLENGTVVETDDDWRVVSGTTNSNDILTSSKQSVQWDKLPSDGTYTATAEDSEKGLTEGETYSVTYTYKVKETKVNVPSGSPEYSFQENQLITFVMNEQTKVYEATLTNDLMDVEAQKTWSDGGDHSSDTSYVTLYRYIEGEKLISVTIDNPADLGSDTVKVTIDGVEQTISSSNPTVTFTVTDDDNHTINYAPAGSVTLSGAGGNGSVVTTAKAGDTVTIHANTSAPSTGRTITLKINWDDSRLNDLWLNLFGQNWSSAGTNDNNENCTIGGKSVSDHVLTAATNSLPTDRAFMLQIGYGNGEGSIDFNGFTLTSDYTVNVNHKNELIVDVPAGTQNVTVEITISSGSGSGSGSGTTGRYDKANVTFGDLDLSNTVVYGEGANSNLTVGQSYTVNIQVYGNDANVNALTVVPTNATITNTSKTWWSDTGGQIDVTFTVTGTPVSFSVVKNLTTNSVLNVRKTLAVAPLRAAAASSPTTYTGDDLTVTSNVTVPDISQMTVVGTYSGTGSWTTSWSNLPTVTADGKKISYYVVETRVDTQTGYTSMTAVHTYSDTEDGKKIVIQNTPTEEGKINVSATKVWKDSDGTVISASNIANELQVKLALYNGETLVSEQTITGNGTATWTGLDRSGSYTVKETAIKLAGDEEFTEITSGDTGYGTVTGDQAEGFSVTNNLPKVELSIVKIELDKPSTTLKGAEFSLWQIDKTSATISKVSGSEKPVTTGDGGTAGFTGDSGLISGYYMLQETKSPDGYVMTGDNTVYFKIIAGKITFLTYEKDVSPENWTERTMASDSTANEGLFSFANKTLTVENEPGVALPSTGGPGTRLFTILGSILILLSGTLLWRRRRWV